MIIHHLEGMVSIFDSGEIHLWLAAAGRSHVASIDTEELFLQLLLLG
jgi:hypothetical protein